MKFNIRPLLPPPRVSAPGLTIGAVPLRSSIEVPKQSHDYTILHYPAVPPSPDTRDRACQTTLPEALSDLQIARLTDFYLLLL
jgi:hypothetical protein